MVYSIRHLDLLSNISWILRSATQVTFKGFVHGESFHTQDVRFGTLKSGVKSLLVEKTTAARLIEVAKHLVIQGGSIGYDERRIRLVEFDAPGSWAVFFFVLMGPTGIIGYWGWFSFVWVPGSAWFRCESLFGCLEVGSTLVGWVIC
ncbi:hypothetical protein R6Q59_024956 [Mikania micrantha]